MAGDRAVVSTLRSAEVEPKRVVEPFSRYMAAEENRVPRAVFERSLAQKRHDPVFAGDSTPLLAPGHEWELESAMEAVLGRMVALLPGDPWKR